MRRLLLWLAGACCAISATARAEPLTLVVDDHPPYIDFRAANGGAAVAATRALFREAGLGEIQLIRAPWLRAFQMVKEGEAVASFPFRWTEARARVVQYGPALLVDHPALFTADGSTVTATRLEDLRGLAICAPLGYALSAPLADMVAQGLLTLHSPPQETLCLEMLREGRADLIQTTPMRLAGLTAAPPRREGLRPLPIFQEPTPLHVIVTRARPDATELQARLTAAAARLDLPERFGDFFAANR